MLLGLDFDNTIICYDKLFHKVALEKSLIPYSVPAEKIAIRDYLIKQGKEDEWTLIQGEVYGKRITEALPYEGVFEALNILQINGVSLVMVSHKTRNPFIGEPTDLRKAALRWLTKHNFFKHQGLNWSMKKVFFELTRELKVKRICELGCTHYIDDLPEVLAMLPENISRIHFFPQLKNKKKYPWTVMKSWNELPHLLR